MAITLADRTTDTDDTGRKVIRRSFHVDTEDEIEQCVEDNPVYNGLTRSPAYHSENWDADTIEGGFRVDLTFQGVDKKNGRNTPEKAKWNFSPSFEKEPIEKHQAINELVQYFQGTVDPETKRVTFPPTFQKHAGANSNLPSRSNHWQGNTSGRAGDTTEEKNPLYGIDESGYLVMLGSASCRYNTTSPADALRDIGKVFSALPYNAPDYEIENRDWLKAPPQIDEIDEVEGDRWFSVEEIFLLSPIGGWPPEVYDFIEI